MTFIVNHDGVVYERDLGDDTDAIARKMTAFDPGPGWIKVSTKPKDERISPAREPPADRPGRPS